MAKANEKIILVHLDAAADPQVEVDRDVGGRSTMKWRKEDPTQDFVFKNIDFDPSLPFTLKQLKDHKIEVENSLAAGKYSYTLTVEDVAGNLYTTTEQGGPPGPGDKPVLRN